MKRLSILFGLIFGFSSALEAAASANVRVNSVGYLPAYSKRASILNGAAATTWNLRLASDSSLAATGALSGAATDTDTSESIKTADFSSFSGSGVYYLEVPGVGNSITFSVQANAYDASMTLNMLGFYGWRCGTAVSLNHKGQTFSHPICHTNDAYLDYLGQAGVKRDGTLGWHDAGDYNKYIVNAGVTVGCMLEAWERHSAKLQCLSLPIPETGGAIPDFLDEIKFELQWVLKMQYGAADGRVSHKLSATGFDPFEMPQAETSPRYFTPYGTAATADFVAMLAKASRIYQPYDPAFATQCLNAATVSWNYLLANLADVQANQTGFSTGGYGTTDTDDRLWAVAEMWETTGNAAYLTDLEARITAQATKCDADWDWGNVKNLGVIVYALSSRSGRNATLLNTVRNAIKSAADTRVTGRNNSGYGRTLKGSYYWGSNGSVARASLVLNAANILFPSQTYLDAAVDQISYLYGRNYYNRSQITGEGLNPPMNPHHRPSGADGITAPWPGYVVGGGQTSTDWSDTEGSYQTNEVAVNWNAAHTFLLAMFYAGCPVGTPTRTPSISPTPSLSPTLTPLPCGPGGNVQRVNVGGALFNGAQSWAADKAYAAGSWGYVAAGSTSTGANPIANTTDDGLYQAQRWAANLMYRFTLPNGAYNVTVKLAETYWTSAGSRVFNIWAEGLTRVAGVDIYASAPGADRAYDLSFFVDVSDGILDLSFIATADNATVAGISIDNAVSGPCASNTFSPSPTRSATGSPTATLSASPTRSASPSLSPSASPSPTRSATATASASSSSSPTSSATRSPTATASASSTGSPTASATRTISNSVTPSATRTPSPTPSVTRSATASATISPTPTDYSTGSPTQSPSASPSFSVSPTYSASSTGSPTESATETETMADSETPTALPSESDTLTATPSATPSLTPTATDYSTGSPTQSSTASPSLTASPSFSHTPYPTESFTQTASSSPTASASPSFTVTPSPSPSPTAGPSPLAILSLDVNQGPLQGGSLVTVTGSGFSSVSSVTLGGQAALNVVVINDSTLTFITPAVSAPSWAGLAVSAGSSSALKANAFEYKQGGEPEILAASAWPNPQSGPKIQIAIKLKGSAESFEIRLYSKALGLVARLESPSSFHAAGWSSATFDAGSLARGLYWYRIAARQGGKSYPSGEIRTLYRLP